MILRIAFWSAVSVVFLLGFVTGCITGVLV